MAIKFYLTYFKNNEMKILPISDYYLPLAIENVEKSLKGLRECGCSDIHICDEKGLIIKRF